MFVIVYFSLQYLYIDFKIYLNLLVVSIYRTNMYRGFKIYKSPVRNIALAERRRRSSKRMFSGLRKERGPPGLDGSQPSTRRTTLLSNANLVVFKFSLRQKLTWQQKHVLRLNTFK